MNTGWVELTWNARSVQTHQLVEKLKGELFIPLHRLLLDRHH